MELFIIYILIGLIGGITAGMLGLGGGIIFVPGLLIVHKINDLFLGYQLQAAVYTSIVCIIFAGSMSAYLHFKNNLVITEKVKRFSVPVILGCLVGIYLLEYLPSYLLENIYSMILLILALLLISDAKLIKNNFNIVNNIGGTYFFLNGTISSLMGIGGGTLSVPYLSFILGDIKKSIATASAIGMVIALTCITFMYFINIDIFRTKLNYMGLIVIVPTSMIGSYIGVSLLRMFDASRVKVIFSTLLVLISIYLFTD